MITQEMKDAFKVMMDTCNKYHCSAGSYDRTHGDNIKIGKARNKVRKLIIASNMNFHETWFALASDYEKSR